MIVNIITFKGTSKIEMGKNVLQKRAVVTPDMTKNSSVDAYCRSIKRVFLDAVKRCPVGATVVVCGIDIPDTITESLKKSGHLEYYRQDK
jgi:hypothetical protein